MRYFLSSSFYHPVTLWTGHLTWNQPLFSLYKNFPFVLLVFIMWTQQRWFFKLPPEQFVKWNATRRKLDIIWAISRHLSSCGAGCWTRQQLTGTAPLSLSGHRQMNFSWEMKALSMQLTNNCRATIDLTSHLTWEKTVQ